MAVHLFTRRVAIAAALALAASPALAWHSTSVSGALPALDFHMTRAADGKAVSEADFKGKVVLLYFGYTFCPDVCPATLMNITAMLKALGSKAEDVRVLFVTVDPGRDTLPVLKQYADAFAPQVVGLRGTPEELANLAKRYRVSYSVERSANGHDVEVTHGSAVYVFDRDGEARLLFTGLSLPNTPLAPMLADLRELVTSGPKGSWWHRLVGFL